MTVLRNSPGEVHHRGGGVPLPGSCAAQYHRADAGALYLHVPFCARKCFYCDFASWATRAGDPLMHAYAQALVSEVREAAELGLLESCTTAYVGGGTPSLLGNDLISLVSEVREACVIEELTCEANPDSLTDDLLDSLGAAGGTRLSIGVQSTNDGELAALGRIHTAAQAADRVQAAVRAGFRTSCDLMCAIPRQTDASWAQSLLDVVGWGVGHVSVYPLAIEEGTAFGRRYANEEPVWNDPDIQANRMEQARDALRAWGLEPYEVASYARPGERCRHNIAYWTGVPYLGLGTGASSMLTREGYERLRSACPQLPALERDVARIRITIESSRQEIAQRPALKDLSFSLELLTQAQAVAEDLMLGMRLTEGVGPGLLSSAKEVLGGALVDETVARVVREGLAKRTAVGGLVPTHRGWLLGNELYGAFWDLAPGHVREVEA